MRTDRREFLSLVGTGLGTYCASRVLASCAAPSSASRADVGAALPPGIDRIGERVLELAARAPSSHNVQPWRVRILESRRWRVAIDPGRQLPAVDPERRELALSLGTFLENLVLGAGALGLEATVEPLGVSLEEELAEVRLAPCAPTGFPLERIERRRTVRKGYRSDSLAAAEVEALRAAAGDCEWFPMDGVQAGWLREAALEAFRQQSWRDDAQAELARWIRFSDEEVARNRDGLNPATMEIDGVAGWYVRHFMNAETVTSKTFRQQGIDGLAEQAGQGAGFLVLTSRGAQPAELLDAGRRYERLMLGLRERGLALHPMSQVLEEGPWREQIARQLGLTGTPQFVCRIGRVDRLPEPVSPRRPVGAFIA